MTFDPTATRRGVLGGIAGLSAVGLTGAATIGLPGARHAALDAASCWNDRVQSALFSAERPAPTFPDAAITRPFPYNGFYPEAYAPAIDADAWRLAVDGRVARGTALSLRDLRAMPQETQITRLICIEGWSAVGKWSGVPLGTILDHIGADRGARYVRFDCAEGYATSIDMASALHPQTILALDFLDRPLTSAFGAPARLRIPTKLGFKNAKFVTRLSVTNDFQGGYWEDRGYNWFAGL